jgi:hypothetical protein
MAELPHARIRMYPTPVWERCLLCPYRAVVDKGDGETAPCHYNEGLRSTGRRLVNAVYLGLSFTLKNGVEKRCMHCLVVLCNIGVNR